ncbi:hypothetical protein VTK73DRAFT_9323 [Phialemonium thermophilum]|uniref:Major facilitator superfamily (MFS) profile domain-containing protein n=1 Tax=Phialemonium thermophilum TaxID=223376 RepID=A0ABR3W3B5_9PEZI
MAAHEENKADDGVITLDRVEDVAAVPEKAAALIHNIRQPHSEVYAEALARYPNDEAIDREDERRLRRKLDLRILPLLGICYFFYYVDKTTLSYAAIFGIRDDLHLSSGAYSWLSSVFYFGWLVWAIPSNLLMQRSPPGWYLGFNILLWGVLLMCQAAARDFASLAALRILSGAFEAIADPAFMLITSMWYTRREQPWKIGLWYTAVGLGNSFGGVLGYGIGNIRGALWSWKYEFLIIGAVCAAWGLVILVFLPDSPVTCRYLTDREKRIVVERLRENQTGVENKTLKPYQILEALTDYKSYLLFMCSLLQAIVNGGTSNFGTLIVKGFHFSTLNTTLLQIPYGALIAVLILLCVYLNDRLPGNNRCWLMVCFLLPNVAGSFGLHYVPDSHRVGRLICYYLTGSINAVFVLLLSLQTGNTAGHTKKVTVSAILFLGYCVGNIAGPFFYKTDQAPTYTLGIWSMITSHLIEIATIVVMRFALQWENRRRDRLYGPVEDMDQREVMATAFGDLTDKENQNFRYVY